MGMCLAFLKDSRAASMAGAELGWQVAMDRAWGPAECLYFEDYSKNGEFSSGKF